ncbi:hypothetical protein FCL53_10605 [Elizabethkingia meningoseptica]|uniref:hypothetical protein n=1 Tax=Elizabethkingia meningoseptica TaxID=238 RepID=UPI001365A6D2|nr:hypothetical protein [Elizabethkingia meningoseptica]MVW92415.1 hypothetical protein [Elizabethkingia meningoseptica]
MSAFDKDKLKLAALEYAEKNKIVNQKTINAFIDGFKLRDSHSSDNVLSYLISVFKDNHDSAKDDAGYGDLRGESYNNRIQQGFEALEISNQLTEIYSKIKSFNLKYEHKY